VKKTSFTIPEIIELAKKEFGIASKVHKTEKVRIASLNKAMRMKIVRTLENEVNENGKPLLQKNAKSTAGVKCKHTFDANTVNWLLKIKLYDYFYELSDCEKTKAELRKKKEYEKRAHDIQDEAFEQLLAESREYKEPTEAEFYGYGNIDFKLTGSDGDRIYRHMIEKIFEVYYTPFDFEQYKKDSLVVEMFSPEYADPDSLPSIDRYEDLTNYYKKR